MTILDLGDGDGDQQIHSKNQIQAGDPAIHFTSRPYEWMDGIHRLKELLFSCHHLVLTLPVSMLHKIWVINIYHNFC